MSLNQDDAYWDAHANPKAKRDQKREDQVRLAVTKPGCRFCR